VASGKFCCRRRLNLNIMATESNWFPNRTKSSGLSPQLVTCRGQAIWYVHGVETICSGYRVSKRPDKVPAFLLYRSLHQPGYSQRPTQVSFLFAILRLRVGFA
jgi:hypothetical protein